MPNYSNLIFARHGKTAKRLSMPMLVGEWGAYGLASSTLPAAQEVVRQFEKLLCSDTYWAHEKGLEQTEHFRAIKRPYPELISGTLKSYQFNPITGIFQCEWKEDRDISTPSRIYIPDLYICNTDDIKFSPFGEGYEIEPIRNGSENLYLRVPPSGKTVQRQLTLLLKVKK